MKEPFYTDLGLRIAAARTGSSMTQTELAARVSISRPSIANIEQGRQALPVHKLIQIAEALNCDPGYLLSSSATKNELAETPDDESGKAFVSRVLEKTK
ncbi:MAG: helix-turn-helix transcriptional regulator [Alloalcanivorax sp.]